MKITEQNESNSGIIIKSVITIVILFLLGIGIVITYIFLKRRQPFTHERLEENDFNNPMYQDRDAEPFSLNADKTNNFVNPVYETVFNGTNTGKEEKTGLLQSSLEDIPNAPSEEI